MDSSKNKKLRVGIFLGIGAFVIMASIVLLGGDKAFFSRNVTLFAKMDQVQGLDRGSIISVSGVTIGNVASIRFSDEQKSLVVEMKIQEEFLSRLTEGSVADVRTQGALGDKYIYISPGDPKGQAYKPGDYIPTAKSTDILGILSEKGGEATKIFDIINEVYKLTQIINADGRSEKIVTNMVETTQNMKLLTDDARKVIAEMKSQNSGQLKESMAHLNSVLTKIDRGDGTLGALINDPSLHERLKAVLGVDSHKQSIQSLIRTSIQKSKD